jgi:hypothetical protein
MFDIFTSLGKLGNSGEQHMFDIFTSLGKLGNSQYFYHDKE